MLIAHQPQLYKWDFNVIEGCRMAVEINLQGKEAPFYG